LSGQPDFDLLRVVLVRTRNPLNIGAVARALSNFGFLHLRVVNPYKVAFREARSAVGASAVLAKAEEFSNVADAVDDCTLVVGTTAARRRELQYPLRPLEDGMRRIRKRLTSGRVAILFGSERTGLSNEELSHCHWLMRIPACEEHPSVNLGQAVAICLYELARNPKIRVQVEKERFAATGEVERISIALLEALRESGYLNPRASALAKEKMRRLVRRLKLSPSDAELWLGMLRKIVWKMSGSHPSSRV
jgi:tRNA/rRNA methyltransferase